MIAPDPAVEWSRPLPVRSVTGEGRTIELDASAEERAALAARFGLVAIDRLAAKLEVQRVDGDLIRVRGTVEADLVQTCVVSLEPFPATVRDEVEGLFGEGVAPADVPEAWVDPEADDLPEPIVDGVIDLGELAAQHLSLGLDPHPRKPDATLDRALIEDVPEGPFAALKGWKCKP
ncbi:YceD family protein [Roseiterribacter gracilis]|uniref:Metal-binding protein n=1 Tax=Roseiterribacter gracilis TaxID=2812848 RepID=A0A8S8XBI5_9PROT|nr:metal-binding protein [Rhodospirillales bacterium TMPK1]